MSIYQRLLGQDFKRLHPKLQQRYTIPTGAMFQAQGVMHRVKGGPFWLKPFYTMATKYHFLFPEQGRAIPFHITNISRMNAQGETEVYWERAFHFANQTRYFNATMTIDANFTKVKDYLGTPALFYSDLHMHVTKEGRLLIRSGVQRFCIKSTEIALPPFLQGHVVVEEGYDERQDVYTIHVSINNPLIGGIMHYAGYFTTSF